jgi:hypothetical protein
VQGPSSIKHPDTLGGRQAKYEAAAVLKRNNTWTYPTQTNYPNYGGYGGERTYRKFDNIRPNKGTSEGLIVKILSARIYPFVDRFFDKAPEHKKLLFFI